MVVIIGVAAVLLQSSPFPKFSHHPISPLLEGNKYPHVLNHIYDQLSNLVIKYYGGEHDADIEFPQRIDRWSRHCRSLRRFRPEEGGLEPRRHRALRTPPPRRLLHRDVWLRPHRGRGHGRVPGALPQAGLVGTGSGRLVDRRRQVGQGGPGRARNGRPRLGRQEGRGHLHAARPAQDRRAEGARQAQAQGHQPVHQGRTGFRGQASHRAHQKMMAKNPHMHHDDDPTALTLAAGETKRLTWRFNQNNPQIEMACLIGRHYQDGMKASVTLSQ